MESIREFEKVRESSDSTLIKSWNSQKKEMFIKKTKKISTDPENKYQTKQEDREFSFFQYKKQKGYKFPGI